MTPMPSLRWRLRDATSEAHARLDARLGEAFDDIDGYAAFLHGMHRFLTAAAPADADGDYADARAALSADLTDLGAVPEAASREAAPAADAMLGWRYVVAGSSLGARVLLPRAQALGFDAQGGARYLAAQASGGDWRRLLAALDAAPAHEADAAIAGARAAFACADRCMTRAFEARAA